MNKKLILFFIFSIILVTCSRILDSEDNKLKLTGFIFNKVTDQPVSSAEVTISGVETKSTLSNANGAFEFDLEYDDETSVSISVEKDSFMTEEFTQLIKPGKDIDLDTIFFEPLQLLTTVKGVLLNDFNDEPISDGVINGDFMEYAANSNSMGEFSYSFYTNEGFTGTIICSKTFFVADTIEFDIIPGYEIDLSTIYLNYKFDPAKLTGTVFDQRADTAITDVKVSVVGESNVYTSTDETGRFELLTQINESKSVSLQFSRYPFDSKIVTLDQVAPEEEVSVGKVELTPPAYDGLTVFGKVKTQRNENLSGVNIYLEQFPEIATQTNAKGYFSFDIELNQETDLNFSFEIDDYQTVTLDTTGLPETDLNLGNIILPDKYGEAHITGQIMDEQNGSAIANAKVLESGSGEYVLSDGNGEFDLAVSLSEPMSLSVEISKYPYETKSISIDNVTPEDLVALGEIKLSVTSDVEPTVISGVLLNQNNAPVVGSTVIIDEFPGITGISGNDGKFSLSLPVVEESMDLNLTISETDIYNGQTYNFQLTKGVNYNFGNIKLASKISSAVVSGIIVDDNTREPIGNVKIVDNIFSRYDSTESNGEFDYELLIFEPQSISFTLSKYPYQSKTISLDQLTPSERISLDTLTLKLPEYEPISISGKLVDKNTQEGIIATINVQEFSNYSATSDQYGYFEISGVPLKKTMNLNFDIKPDNQEFYSDTSLTYKDAVPEQNINFNVIELPNKFNAVPKAIVLEEVERPSIQVKESGGISTSQISFKVLNQIGEPIDLTTYFGLNVNIEMISDPGGGTQLSNNSIETNSNGIARTTLISGTNAGVVQLHAYFDYDGETIESSPVPVNIHAGLPAYFNKLQAAMVNVPIPYYAVHATEPINVLAQVADKYQNIIKEATAIYFTPEDDGYDNGAIMDADGDKLAITDEQGIANVNYWTPDHLPADEWVMLYGSTSGEDGVAVLDSFQLLLTGEPMISNFVPANATIDQGGSETIDFKVWDENEHPLSEGTTLDITVTPDTLASVTHNFPEDGIEDVQDGSTDFSFTVTDNPSNTSGGSITIKIYVKSRNGNLTVTYPVTLNGL